MAKAWRPAQEIDDTDPLISDAKGKLAKFSYGKGLGDSDVYTPEFGVALRQWQGNIHYQVAFKSRPGPDVNMLGVFDWAVKKQMGLLEETEPVKPVIFTVEGHLSDMLIGPAYFTAKTLEDMGLVRVQPIGYDNVALPFRTQTGIDELTRCVNDPVILPPTAPWLTFGFSQGSIATSTYYLDHIRPNRTTGKFANWKGGINFGNPYRELNVCAPWVPDPPKPGTEGLSPRRIDNTPPELAEVSRTGDMYAEVKDENPATEHMRAIYQAAAENKWLGPGDTLGEQIAEIVTNPFGELWPLFTAMANGVRFVGNMSPHGAYDLAPCVAFARKLLNV